MSIISFSRRQFILSCLSSTFFFRAAEAVAAKADFAPFTFAFVSDCHLSVGKADNVLLLQESQLFLQDVIKQLNILRPDFVVFGGDQSQGLGDNDTNWQLFLDVLQGLDCPWYFVLGETDVIGNPPINKMISYGRDWKGHGLDNANPYWSYDPAPGVHLIGLDTSQVNSSIGNLDQAQIDWLDLDMQKHNSALTILVSHHPLILLDEGSKADYGCLPQAESIRAILERSKRKILVLNGHMHISKIQQHNNIWYISSPSLDVYPCAFRVFKVEPEQVEVQTYQVNFPALIKKAQTNLLNSDIARSFDDRHPNRFLHLALGSHEDRNAILPL